jgi:murein L,D-transpeptidase YafK
LLPLCNPVAALLLVLLPLILVPAPVHGAQAEPYHIEVYRKEKRLLLLRGDQVIRSYHVAFGRGGSGAKRRAGDNKTPLGVYRIADFNSDSKFHFFMLLDYPNVVDAWHGYRNAVIDAGDFRAIATAYSSHRLPPQDTPLGGRIGIHGIGDTTEERLRIHELQDWTEGCIALTNEEISELRRFVSIGTRVVIRE